MPRTAPTPLDPARRVVAPRAFRACSVLGPFAFILYLAGCQSEPVAPEMPAGSAGRPRPALAELAPGDPCAERLQDLGGALLAYGRWANRLPESLDDLRRSPLGTIVEDFKCPVSGKPYVYNPAGLYVPKSPGRIVLYDPEPSHAGGRIGLMLVFPGGNRAPYTDLRLFPDEFFTRPQPEPAPEPEPTEPEAAPAPDSGRGPTPLERGRPQ